MVLNIIKRTLDYIKYLALALANMANERLRQPPKQQQPQQVIDIMAPFERGWDSASTNSEKEPIFFMATLEEDKRI